ncbi:fluoride efflux transporter FluC [Planomonospora venezuelensis]|uniref:Fluoride-specific ion channel FluC n=1 Tax=Planomonospora venezuelensis TaxID=1999 RepID=A0A841D1X9_PLAVE|nr:CrcB family protein [Planomonospora venezuelensis]MBB5962993.1 CrcB protein [Planomonospora venezuelensis]GIN00561.1 putative fluoride ion transporter CrcB 1 [Planomonospora venezuelensis]
MTETPADRPDDPPVPPVDPDVDLHLPRQRAELRQAPWSTLAAISVGGVIGALARYGLAEAFPRPAGGFPWATFATNAAGCALIGVLMVLITETRRAHRLTRPFLGAGVLGGFTTFSAYIADIGRLAAEGAPGLALVYLSATALAAVAAVHLAAAGTRAITRPRRTDPAAGEAA